MKRFIMKFLNFMLNFIIVIGSAVSVCSVIMQFVPASISEPILNWLNTNLDMLMAYGGSSLITTVILGFAKYFNTALKVSLKDSEFKQSLQRKQLQESYNERLDIAEQRDLAIVELINKNSELVKTLIEQNQYIIAYEQLVAKKNISSSIIPDKYKEEFRQWISDLKANNNKQVVNEIIVADEQKTTSNDEQQIAEDVVKEERELL